LFLCKLEVGEVSVDLFVFHEIGIA
jgi:hypothetical protein